MYEILFHALRQISYWQRYSLNIISISAPIMRVGRMSSAVTVFICSDIIYENKIINIYMFTKTLLNNLHQPEEDFAMLGKTIRDNII